MVTVTGRPADPAATRELTYDAYLCLPELLGLQRPRSTHPDELHFVVVHQAMELWFRLLTHDLRRLVELLDSDRITESCTVLRRVNDVLPALLAQLRTLRALPSHSFHRFRGHLGSASGFQSTQFRELEVVSGLRDEGYLRDLSAACGGTLPPTVTRALSERSVAQAHQDAARRDGLTDWTALHTESRLASPLYLLSEQLLDYDELWLRWRSEHVSLVRRMIGSFTRGTGGTPISYLERTLRHRFFPYLWETPANPAAKGSGGPTPRCGWAGV